MHLLMINTLAYISKASPMEKKTLQQPKLVLMFLNFSLPKTQQQNQFFQASLMFVRNAGANPSGEPNVQAPGLNREHCTTLKNLSRVKRCSLFCRSITFEVKMFHKLFQQSIRKVLIVLYWKNLTLKLRHYFQTLLVQIFLYLFLCH